VVGARVRIGEPRQARGRRPQPGIGHELVMQGYFRDAGLDDRMDLGAQPVGEQEIVGHGEPTPSIRHER
jgi:hypothetical protein